MLNMYILIYWLSGIYYQHQIIIKLPNSWKKRLDCAIINKWKNKGGSDFWKRHLHLIYSKKFHINWLYWEGIGHLSPDLKPWELDDKKKKLSFRKKLEALSVSIGHIPAVQPPTNMAMYISHFLITWSISQKSPPPPISHSEKWPAFEALSHSNLRVVLQRRCNLTYV